MFGNEAEYFTDALKWNSNTTQHEVLSNYHFGLSEYSHQDYLKLSIFTRFKNCFYLYYYFILYITTIIIPDVPNE
jgi:hypothetical protein